MNGYHVRDYRDGSRRYRRLVERFQADPKRVQSGCSVKRAHPSRRHALAEAKRLADARGIQTHAYKCGAGHWHVSGHAERSEAGAELRDRRRAAGITIEAFADRHGLDVRYVSAVERGAVLIREDFASLYDQLAPEAVMA